MYHAHPRRRGPCGRARACGGGGGHGAADADAESESHRGGGGGGGGGDWERGREGGQGHAAATATQARPAPRARVHSTGCAYRRWRSSHVDLSSRWIRSEGHPLLATVGCEKTACHALTWRTHLPGRGVTNSPSESLIHRAPSLEPGQQRRRAY